MNTQRTDFLSKFTGEISGLNYVLLNYSNRADAAWTRDRTFEILISREDYPSLLYILSNANHVKTIRTRSGFCEQLVEIKFKDHSRLLFKIKICIRKKGFILMSASEILEGAKQVNDRIKVPLPAHQFEYFLLKSTLDNKPFSAKAQEFIDKLSFEERAQIFAHIVPKYKVVINLLDDLIDHRQRYRHRIIATLRKSRHNKGIRFFINHFYSAYTYIRFRFFDRWQALRVSDSEGQPTHAEPRHLLEMLQKYSVNRT